ncbi:MAG: cation transporter [Clostridiales bacterium]|nr:cation transporter [Clostridiales bacterium]
MYDNPLVKRDNFNRQRATLKATVLSMLLNVLLAAGKIICGALFGAISVLADGFNNLSDCGSNIITVTGVKLSAKPADKEHPYGHARGEYIAAMAVAFIILLLAVELFSQSLDKIISGTGAEFSILAIVVLSVGIAVKLFMFFYNRHLGKKYSSEILLATAVDSISDVIASAVVLISIIVGHFTPLNPDGYIGCLVAVVIAISGIKILKRTISELIGESPSKELTDEIKKRLLCYEGIYGIHDLAVHNYVNKYYASVHVEIDADTPVLAAHELIDKIEKDFALSTDIDLTIHLDPVVLHDSEVIMIRQNVEEILKRLYPVFTMHDFRMVKSYDEYKIIFEVCVPYETKESNEQIIRNITDKLLAEYSLKYTFLITVEHDLVR